MNKEEAIEILNGDIKGYYISQKQNGISEKYEQSINTVLNYIKELEEKIKLCEDTGTKLINKKTLTDNFINKQVIRDKIEELEKEVVDYRCEENRINVYQRRVLKELLEEE